jgi:hypothetical protein
MQMVQLWVMMKILPICMSPQWPNCVARLMQVGETSVKPSVGYHLLIQLRLVIRSIQHRLSLP